MSPLGRDQLALLRVLARHGVEFVVVGGVLAQIHGCVAQRQTSTYRTKAPAVAQLS
jgi:hypothetical protein